MTDELPPLSGDRLVELEIPARPEYLGLARLVVAAAADLDPTFASERIDDLRLAVSEAATNAIEAQASIGADDRVTIRCNLGEDQIEVEIRDHGEGFDPEAPRDPGRVDDTVAREGGFGLPLIRSVSDQSTFIPGPDGTLVRLTIFTQRR